MGLYLIGWLLVGVTFLVTQSRFYDAYRRVHGRWRPGVEAMRTTFFYTPAEHRAMLRATFRVEENPTVERARRRYLSVVVATVAYLVLAIPVALLRAT